MSVLLYGTGHGAPETISGISSFPRIFSYNNFKDAPRSSHNINPGDWFLHEYGFLGYDALIQEIQTNLNKADARNKEIVIVSDVCFSGTWCDRLVQDQDKIKLPENCHITIQASSNSYASIFTPVWIALQDNEQRKKWKQDFLNLSDSAKQSLAHLEGWPVVQFASTKPSDHAELFYEVKHLGKPPGSPYSKHTGDRPCIWLFKDPVFFSWCTLDFLPPAFSFIPKPFGLDDQTVTKKLKWKFVDYKLKIYGGNKNAMVLIYLTNGDVTKDGKILEAHMHYDKPPNPNWVTNSKVIHINLMPYGTRDQIQVDSNHSNWTRWKNKLEAYVKEKIPAEHFTSDKDYWTAKVSALTGQYKVLQERRKSIYGIPSANKFWRLQKELESYYLEQCGIRGSPSLDVSCCMFRVFKEWAMKENKEMTYTNFVEYWNDFTLQNSEKSFEYYLQHEQEHAISSKLANSMGSNTNQVTQQTFYPEQIFAEEIKRLTLLKDGWHHGEGKAVAPILFDVVKEFVTELTDYPGIAPTYEGGILLIWEDLQYFCELTPSREMQSVGPGNNYQTFNLDTKEGKKEALSCLKSLLRRD